MLNFLHFFQGIDIHANCRMKVASVCNNNVIHIIKDIVKGSHSFDLVLSLFNSEIYHLGVKMNTNFSSLLCAIKIFLQPETKKSKKCLNVIFSTFAIYYH